MAFPIIVNNCFVLNYSGIKYKVFLYIIVMFTITIIQISTHLFSTDANTYITLYTLYIH